VTKRLRLTILALALLGSAAALWLVLVSEHEDHPALTAGIVLLISWAFVVGGLIASSRRQGSRFGLLMCAVGLTTFVAALSDANASIPFTIGVVLGNLFVGVFIHALLSFPSGYLRSRAARVTAVAAYCALILGQIGALLFDDLESYCADCPDNALLVTRSDAANAAIETALAVLGLLIALAIIVILGRRWRSATPPLRRALAPVLSTGGAVIVLIALIFATSVALDRVSAVLSWVATGTLALFPFAFLAGLVRIRLARAAVGRLVVELGETPQEAEVRDALRKALNDPSIQLAYWRPDTRTFVASSGRPISTPQPGDDRASTMIERNGEPVVALIHDPSLDQDPELIEAAAAAAGLALENERLQAELRARLEDLRASRARIVEAQGIERRRLERDLHDGAQQRLVSLALRLRLAQTGIEADPAQAREELARASNELALAVDELRELARGLHPAVLSDRGLHPALEALALRAPLPVEIAADLDQRLPEAVEVAAYYVVAEALTNVVKHARATVAMVRVGRAGHHVVVEVVDDGIGGADPEGGSGLRGLLDRVETLDGRLEVSSPHGGGTRIRAEFPLDGTGDDRAPTPA
jgi:signal transduction histidine kinase